MIDAASSPQSGAAKRIGPAVFSWMAGLFGLAADMSRALQVKKEPSGGGTNVSVSNVPIAVQAPACSTGSSFILWGDGTRAKVAGFEKQARAPCPDTAPTLALATLEPASAGFLFGGPPWPSFLRVPIRQRLTRCVSPELPCALDLFTSLVQGIGLPLLVKE